MARMARASNVHDLDNSHIDVSHPTSSWRLRYLDDDFDVCIAERAGAGVRTPCCRMRVRNRARDIEGLGAVENILQWRPNGNKCRISRFGLPCVGWFASHSKCFVIPATLYTCLTRPSDGKQFFCHISLWQAPADSMVPNVACGVQGFSIFEPPDNTECCAAGNTLCFCASCHSTLVSRFFACSAMGHSTLHAAKRNIQASN